MVFVFLVTFWWQKVTKKPAWQKQKHSTVCSFPFARRLENQNFLRNSQDVLLCLTTLCFRDRNTKKPPSHNKINFAGTGAWKCSCGATLLDVISRPLMHTIICRPFLTEGQLRRTYSEGLRPRFRLPLEVHSAVCFLPQSHRLRLSFKKVIQLTYSSSTVYVIIALKILFVNSFLQNFKKIFRGAYYSFFFKLADFRRKCASVNA